MYTTTVVVSCVPKPKGSIQNSVELEQLYVLLKARDYLGSPLRASSLMVKRHPYKMDIVGSIPTWLTEV